MEQTRHLQTKAGFPAGFSDGRGWQSCDLCGLRHNSARLQELLGADRGRDSGIGVIPDHVVHPDTLPPARLFCGMA